jgi:hypothetical protein
MVQYARQRGVDIAGPRGVAIAGTLKSRVEHIIEMAKKHGQLVQHGKHWHLGSAKGGYATIEKFDRVPVVKGEPPILLPKADEPSTALTMTEVRRMVRAMLEQKDSEGTK